MIKENWDVNAIRADSWEELLEFIATRGRRFGWELREPREPVTPEDIARFRAAGVPESELPPKYMEVWATKSCFFHYGGKEHLWTREDPVEVGYAGVSYVFNAQPYIEEFQNRFVITLTEPEI